MPENSPETNTTSTLSKVWVVTSTYNSQTIVSEVYKDKKNLLKHYPNLKGDNKYCTDMDKNGNGIKAICIKVQ